MSYSAYIDSPDVSFKKVDGGFTVTSIKGSGGGGGRGGKGGRKQEAVPDEPNNLRSKSYAKALFALCEGPIAGPPSGDILRDIYLDRTPLRSASGTLNFSGFSVEWRSGTEDQAIIPGFNKIGRAGPNVGITLRNGIPQNRVITDTTTNAVIVRFRIPSLREITDKNTIGSSVRVQVRITDNNGLGVEHVRVDDTIQGKSSSSFDKSYEIDLHGTGPWRITADRLTADSNSDRIFNDINWVELTEVTYTNSNFANTSVLAITIDSEQFSSFPTVHVDFNWQLVRLPHNWNATAETYDGAFNGSLNLIAWTQNPVWVIYDLLTDTRYGASVPERFIDVYNFYSQAVYCNERVPDLFGGTRKRWTFNGFVEQIENAFNICDAIADSFNASLYWSGGKIKLSVDRPDTMSRIYSPANVIVEVDEDGQETTDPFTYEYTPIVNRTNIANVAYADPSNFYESTPTEYRDEDAVTYQSIEVRDITKFGCTSLDEATMFGKWFVVTEQLTERTIQFQIASDGMLVDPGDVVGINDPIQAGRQYSGRIVEVAANYIKTDVPVALDVGTSQYSLLTIGTDGKNISTVIDTDQTGTLDTDTIYIIGAFSSTPIVDTVWAIEYENLKLDQFRIVSVDENEDGTYTLSGPEYIDKYPTIESGTPYNPPITSQLVNPLSPPSKPTNIIVDESLFVTTNSAGVRVKVDLSWQADSSDVVAITRFFVEYKQTIDNEWQYAGDSFSRSLTIFDLEPGDYNFRVTAISVLNIKGRPGETNQTILGLLDPPAKLENFEFQYLNGFLLFKWKRTEDLDVLIGGKIDIRHTPRTGVNAAIQSSFNNAILLETYPGSAKEALLPPLDGTYLIKPRDSSGKQSIEAAAIEFDGSNIIQKNIVLTINEHDISNLFTGAKSGVVLNTGTSSVRLSPYDENNNAPTGPIRQGTYNFANRVDLGFARDFNVTSRVLIESFNESIIWGEIFVLWSTIDALWSQYGLENPIDDTEAILEIRTSLDDVAWSNWSSIQISKYYARYAEFRIILTSNTPIHNIDIYELSVTIDMDDITQSATITTIPTTQTTVSYPRRFWQTPILAPSLLSPVAGEYIEVLTQNESGFTFAVMNASAQIVPGKQVTYIARGY